MTKREREFGRRLWIETKQLTRRKLDNVLTAVKSATTMWNLAREMQQMNSACSMCFAGIGTPRVLQPRGYGLDLANAP